MSMHVILIRLDDDQLKAVRTAPNLIDALVFGDPKDAPPGFNAAEQMFTLDYRHFCVPYFEYLAAEAGDDPEDFEASEAVTTDPIYRAFNGDDLLDYAFCYGPASVHSSAAVRALATAWRAYFEAADLADDTRIDVALFKFYQAAAKAGCAMVCGVA